MSLQHRGLQLRDLDLELRTNHLVAVRGIPEPGHLGFGGGQVTAQCRQPGGRLGAGPGEPVALRPGRGDQFVEAGQQSLAELVDDAGDLGTATSRRGRARGPGPGLALGLGGTPQSGRLPPDAGGPLLGGPVGEPGLELRGPGRGDLRLGGHPAVIRRELLVAGVVAGARESVRELGVFGARGVELVHRDASGLLQPPHVGLSPPAPLPDARELGVDLLDRRIRLGDGGHRLRVAVRTLDVLGLRARELGPRRLDLPAHLFTLGLGGVDRGLDLDPGPAGRRTTHRPAGARQFALPCHRTDASIRVDLSLGRREVVHHHHVDQERRHRSREVGWCIHHVQGPSCAVDEVHLEPVVATGHTPPDEPGAAGVRLAQRRQNVATIHLGAHHHGVDGRAEGHSHGPLPPVPDGEHLAHGAGDRVGTEVPQHPFSSVPGPLVLFEGLDPGGESGDLLIRLALDRLQLGQACAGCEVCPLGPPEMLVESALALPVDGYPRVNGVELRLGFRHRIPRGRRLGVHAGDLGLGGLDPGRQGLDLAGQSGETLATIGDRPDGLEVFGLQVRECRLGPGQGFGGLPGTFGRAFDVLGELLLVGGGALGLTVEFVRVRPVVDRHLGGQRPGAVGGDAGGGAGTFGQRGQGEPALLCGVGIRGEFVEFGLSRGHLPGQFVATVHGFCDALLQPVAYVLGVGQLTATGDQVIGGEPKRGVP